MVNRRMKMLPTRVPYVLTIAPGLHFHIGAVTSGQRFVDAHEWLNESKIGKYSLNDVMESFHICTASLRKTYVDVFNAYTMVTSWLHNESLVQTCDCKTSAKRNTNCYRVILVVYDYVIGNAV